MVKICGFFEKRKTTYVAKESLYQHDDGKGPWDKIENLFEIDNRTYLLTINYYTNYTYNKLTQALCVVWPEEVKSNEF